MAKKHENEMVTRRAYMTDLRAASADDGQRIIEGRPIVFDSESTIHDWGGDYREIITRNALANTDLSDVCLFINHEQDKIPLARSRKGKGTLALQVDEQGMAMRAVLDVENNAEARALYSAVERGDITGMSFCFRVRADRWEDLESDRPLRYIDDISIIHEVSAVTEPAYPQTSITARSSEEAGFSPLVEARQAAQAAAQESASKDALELEKAKNKVKSWI